MSKVKYFVFQEDKSGLQTEVGRKQRGAGRPPVGPNIVKDEDGNVYISNVLTVKPQNVKDGIEYVKAECDNGTIVWYEKSKPASRASAHKYKMEDGKLVDEGVSGRGRPSTGYIKIETDKVIDGVNLNGHFFNDGTVVEKKTVTNKTAPVVNADTEIDDEDADLEAQAAADAMADIAAEYDEVEIEEEEPV